MKIPKPLKPILSYISEYAATFAIVFSLLGGSYVLVTFFAPKFESARHSAFKESTAYNDGMIQELQKYYVEYQNADDSGKQSIRAVIQHQYAGYPTDKLPTYLQSFVSQFQ